MKIRSRKACRFDSGRAHHLLPYSGTLKLKPIIERAMQEFSIGDSITHRVLVLSNTYGTSAMRFYGNEFGIQLSEWRLLASLASADGPKSVIELAERLVTDKGWVSRTSKSLLKKGLIVAKQHPTDGRKFELSLSEAGEALYQRILPLATERLKQLTDVLSQQELEQFFAVLDRLQKRADSLK